MWNLAAIRLRTKARQAARRQDWTAAVNAYRAYVARVPGDAGSWIQYGHVAKEAGSLDTAGVAYRQALVIEPDNAETWWHLAFIHKRSGNRAAAIECCARAVTLDPDFTAASDELIALGARDRIATGTSQQAPAGGGDRDLAYGSAVYAPSRYDAFRQQVAIGAPPSAGPAVTPRVTVLIDAREALPVEVRATLSSLLDQADGLWQATVYAPPAIADHPVASLAAIDPRVRFVAADAPIPGADIAPSVFLMGAGTVLDRQALAWFAFAAARTQCVAAYGDHDRLIDDWRTGRTFMQPQFQPVFDPDWFEKSDKAPLVILVDQHRLPLTACCAHDTGPILVEAASIGPVAHLPLLLASRKLLAAQAEQAPPDAAVTRAVLSRPAHKASLRSDVVGHRIQVVIQTRDQSDMLKAAIDSLRNHAARPELLDITIVDNRSIELATDKLLAGYRRYDWATVLTLDEPFNWSRANNLAVEDGAAPLLLFLNNDTQMLTQGWDDDLRRALADSAVGVVGATLLYPDRTIQHAGIIMGMGSGGPIHEGVGRLVDSGPSDRWRTPRSAAAVTGAFLAMRREVFIAIGGFDAHFAIAFNDIDLCLRVRAAGHRVVMAADIQVIHLESKTRGMNVTRSQVAWDLDELGRLHDRWGSALFDDPAYNPHWTRTGHPFDGYRFPSWQEIVRHLDRSAGAMPWAPVVADHDPYWW
jgi:GT2 family glycosyltransferase